MAARKTPVPDLSALNLPDGMTKPYRPKPGDFRVIYIRMGWDGIEEHYGTNWRVIRRWIEMEGRDGLIAARAAYVEAKREESRQRRKRYVLGRTLTAVKPKRGEG
jgi:hypothetical protein